MRGLIEMAIEREAERLDAIFEADETVIPPFFTPRTFRPRIHPQTRKFARTSSRGRFATSGIDAQHYAH